MGQASPTAIHGLPLGFRNAPLARKIARRCNMWRGATGDNDREGSRGRSGSPAKVKNFRRLGRCKVSLRTLL
jgi:hypothetical protein